MGSPEAKANLKAHVSKLVDKRTDLSDQSKYWDLLWTLPTSMDDISAVFQPADIRYVRDSHPEIFTKLINVITNRLIYLANLHDVRLSKFPVNQLMNCIRLLTLIIPFLYEKKQLNYIENDIFWNRLYHTPVYYKESNSDNQSSNDITIGFEDVDSPLYSNSENDSTIVNHDKLLNNEKPVGAELIISLLDLLFCLDFTVENETDIGINHQTFANDFQFISWEPGFDVTGMYHEPSLKHDSNRLEIIRLMLVLFSKNLYTSVPDIVNSGSKFLTVLVSSIDGRKFYYLCLSLLNLILRSLQSNDTTEKDNAHINPNSTNNNGLEISNDDHKKIRILLVTTSFQLFTLMVVYAIPKRDSTFLFKHNILSSNEIPRNRTRMFLNKILNPQDIHFVIKTFTSPLFKPIINNSSGAFSYLMKSSKLIEDDEIHIWSSELIIIILELYQCNSKFRSSFAELIGADYLVLLIYFVLKYKDNKKYAAFVRLTLYNMLFLSSDLRLAIKLLSPFDMQLYQLLPQTLRTSSTPTSFRDFLVIHICNVIGSDCSYEYLLPVIQILYNLISLHIMVLEYNKRENREVLSKRRLSIKDLSKCPPTQLSYAASNSIMQVINKLSNINYLSVNSDKNSDCLSLILRSCCNAIARDPSDTVVLLYVFSRNINSFLKLEDSINKVSDHLCMDLLLKEKREYEINIHNQQVQLQQQIYQSQQQAEGDNQINDYINESKESFDLSLSRQNTQNTLESVPSIRSMPALTKQTSQISISNGEPRIINTNMDDSIDPINSNTSINNIKNEENNKDLNTDDCKIIPYNDEVFKAELPIGMTEKSKSKQPYYHRFKDKWAGSESLIFLKECLKAISRLTLLQKSNTETANKPADATEMIHRLMKLDLENIIKKIEKPEIYQYEKCMYQPLKLRWNNASLGWYVSVVWIDIYLNYNCFASRGILADISSGFSAIKKASSTWGFGGWKLMANNDQPPSSPLSYNGFTFNNSNNTNDNNSINENNGLDVYYDNLLKNSVWFGTHIQLFRVNPVLIKEHYTLQHGKSELFTNNANNSSIISPVFSEVFWKRNSISSPILRNGSGIFTEGFWKRQGGRPNSLDRRDSDGSLKSQLSRGTNGNASRGNI